MRTMKTSIGLVALLVGACGSDENSYPGDVQLDAPETGFQLTVGPFDIPPASEIQDCYYFRVSEATNVNRFEIALNQGTHHMNMFRVQDQPDLAFDDGDVQRGCWDS